MRRRINVQWTLRYEAGGLYVICGIGVGRAIYSAPGFSRHILGRWLRGFDAGGVKALLEAGERLEAEVIQGSGFSRLTLHVDGSVVPAGLHVAAARRGFNPHRGEVPRYCPITAYEAKTGQVLRVRNRAGNVHDGKASVASPGELF